MEVRCEPKGAAAFTARARDVSVGGMFVESEERPAFGTEISIVGRPPGAGAPLVLPGVVRWSKDDGFGVQFGLLGAKETHALTLLLK